MSIQTAYNDWSTTYDADRNLTRDLDRVITLKTLGQLRCKCVLELGCGTGKNTALLANVAERVCTIDFSAGMISRAREKLHFDNVIFAVADITRAWPIAEEAADLISANLVLEHIHDLPFIFAAATRSLRPGGRFFISELHPFRQYQGVQANFTREQTVTEIPAFLHHLSDFTNAAGDCGLTLTHFREWWHEGDQNKVPRLVSFLF
ncbi:MAG: class I SAM-dependent DNA methyltransferase, partial [Pyrinomonadaceae bacterium]